MEQLQDKCSTSQSPIREQIWPKDGLEAIPSCPICGEVDRTLLHSDLTDNVFFTAPGRWTLYRCSHCGTAYLNPRPTPSTIALAYEHYYTHTEDSVAHGKLAHIKRCLRNGYINAQYHAHIQPAWKIGPWIALLIPHKKQQIDEGIRHLPSTGKPGVLVDIGCGNGHFLRTAMQLGWETWGVDMDPKAVETAKKTGATIMQGSFPNTGLPSDYFDWVTLHHVIEHVHDPLAALREVFRILKPGGHIWLATPNIDSLGHALFGANWRGLEPPRHLCIFHSNSLERALKSVGFTDIERKPCLPQATWFYESSLRISHGQDPYGTSSITLPLKLKIAARYADIRAARNPSHCETITMIARRP